MKINNNRKKIIRKIGKMLIPHDKHEFEMMMPFEMCRCGHQRQDHDNTISLGHGRCMYGHGLVCGCNKFTFTGRYVINEQQN